MKRYLAVIILLFSVASRAQTISYTGAFASIATTYGTASAVTSIRVTGAGLTADMVATVNAGFEISTDNIIFGNSVDISPLAGIVDAMVYIRLTATSNANLYPSGMVMLNSTGAAPVNVPIPGSSIAPAPLTVTTPDVHKPYGNVLLPYTGTGIYTVVGGSLKNGNTLNTVTITYGTGYNSSAPVGTYAGQVIMGQLTGNNGFLITNYDVHYQNANIIIEKVPLVIKAKNETKTYGTSLSNGSSAAFTSTGLQNQETIGSVTINYGNGAAATDIVNTYIGQINIIAAAGGSFSPGNYAISYIAGDITVIPAQLTITANDQSKIKGDVNPILTFSYAGFVNGDLAGQLNDLPIITTTATTTSPVGKYPITLSGASATNYTFVYVPGVLTVYPVPVIVLIIPNTFTPNGDGINDTWGLDQVLPAKSTVDIFDRNGSNIYTSTGYGTPWDGTYKGEKLPAGTYYYVIDLKNGQKPISGSVTIIR